MEATGVFSSWVTALMKASCCSFRRISRTRNVVFRTTPAMIRASSTMPKNRRMPERQPSRTQPTYRSMTTRVRPVPSAMKNAIDFLRPVPTMLPAYSLALPSLSGFALDKPAVQLGHFEIGSESDALQNVDQNPGVVDLVPGQPVANRCWMGMVVVVPAFAKRQCGNPPVVPRVVARGKPASAPHMSSGIDQPRGVQTKNHPHTNAPEHQRQAADRQQNGAEYDHRHPVPVVQFHIKTMLRQVGRILRHQLRVVVVAFTEDDPAHVGPEKAAVPRGMGVARLIRFLMVGPMYRYPEYRPAFEAQRSAKREKVLQPQRAL